MQDNPKYFWRRINEDLPKYILEQKLDSTLRSGWYWNRTRQISGTKLESRNYRMYLF